MSGVSAVFLNNTSTYYRLLPILTPCLKKDSCKEDFDLKMKRGLITVVAISAIVLMVGCMPQSISGNRFVQISADSEDLPPELAIFIYALAIVICSYAIGIISALPILIWDQRRTDQAADSKAVEEYINLEIPSKEATFHIRHNLTALQLLIAQKGDVNKQNIKGERLLDYTPNLKIHELLTKHADTTLLNRYGVSCFERAIERENPEYLRCILKHNASNPTKITPDNFPGVEQQMRFWEKARSAETIYLLHEFGFNVNIQDNDGCTPLLKLLEKISLGKHKNTISTPSEEVYALLSCGANPEIEGMVIENGKSEKQKKTAVEIEMPSEISEEISPLLDKTDPFHAHYRVKKARLPETSLNFSSLL